MDRKVWNRAPFLRLFQWIPKPLWCSSSKVVPFTAKMRILLWHSSRNLWTLWSFRVKRQIHALIGTLSLERLSKDKTINQYILLRLHDTQKFGGLSRSNSQLRLPRNRYLRNLKHQAKTRTISDRNKKIFNILSPKIFQTPSSTPTLWNSQLFSSRYIIISPIMGINYVSSGKARRNSNFFWKTRHCYSVWLILCWFFQNGSVNQKINRSVPQRGAFLKKNIQNARNRSNLGQNWPKTLKLSPILAKSLFFSPHRTLTRCCN